MNILVIFFSFLTLLSFSCSEYEKKKERDAPGCVDGGGGIYDDSWVVTKYDNPPLFFLFDFLKITQKKIDFFFQAKVTVIM